MKRLLFALACIALGIFSLFFSSFQVSRGEEAEKNAVWNQVFDINTQNTWIRLPREATAFGVKVPKDTIVSVQTSGEEWKKVIREEEDPELLLIPETPDFDPSETDWSELQFSMQPFREFRFRTEHTTPESLQSEKIEFSFIDSRITVPLTEAALSTAGNEGLNIISRAMWGANESLRFVEEEPEDLNGSERDPEATSVTKQRLLGCNDLHLLYPDEFEIDRVVRKESGRTLLWPLQYSSKIEKIVIHHTAATSHLERDSQEVMRAVYAYHARSRGWGDIGYHFVIDGSGNIYEGRAGGNYVIGGHVYCSNVQSIGIALMGNFQEQSPTDGQIAALERLLPVLADTYDLELTGSSVFHGKDLPNLLGHRDLGATACPGENMYGLLSTVRSALKKSPVIRRLLEIDRSAEFTGVVSFLKMEPGESKQLRFTFKNTGNVTWNRGTWLYVVNPKTGVKARSRKPEKTYVAGLLQESEVSPGKTGTFLVDIETGFEGGLYSLEFSPVVDERKISDASVVQPVEVTAPQWGGYFDRGQIVTQPKVPLAGERISFSVPIKNVGNTLWSQKHVSLELVVNGKEYMAQLKEGSVYPGKTTQFTFSLDPFPEEKRYLLRARLLVNGRPMKGVKMFVIPFAISKAEIKARMLSPCSQSVCIVRTGMDKNGNTATEFKIMNSGNVSWEKEDLQLIVFGNNKKYTFQMQENTVNPQEVAHFSPSFRPSGNGLLRYSFWLRLGSRKVFGVGGKWLVMRSPSAGITQSTREVSVPPTRQEVNSEKDIRIHLGYSGDNIEIFGSTTFDLLADQKKIGGIQKDDVIHFDKSDQKISINRTSYSVVRLVPQNTNDFFTISSWDRRPAWDQTGRYNDNKFRGTLEIRVYGNELVVINELPLEEYLLGLAETGNNTHAEKHKVIAILARTYALFYMQSENEKFPGAPYDGDDSPERFQKYLGYSYELRNHAFTEAVKATAGKVVTYQGKLIKTPYFSQSDGRTRSAEEVWGWTNTPYLQSVDDPYCAGSELKGHGVGLSGCGAEAAAQGGKTYEEIIKYYYQGVEVKEL